MMEAVAEACGVPMAWFEVDFAELGNTVSQDEAFDRMERLCTKLTRTVTRLADRDRELLQEIATGVSELQRKPGRKR